MTVSVRVGHGFDAILAGIAKSLSLLQELVKNFFLDCGARTVFLLDRVGFLSRKKQKIAS